MPEASSFAWNPSLSDASWRGEDDVSAEGQSLEERSDDAPKKLVIDTEPTQLSIFELTTRFDVPAVNLSTLQGVHTSGPNSPPRLSYGLGAGVSCSVSLHQTADDIDGCPRGTKVALKKYRDIPGDKTSNKRLHKLLWQELKVFCHPLLKTHENICKLHFIGWEETTLVPVLALEFAVYGTLDDCLQDLRSYHSDTTKTHLSLDIALGLEAIHVSGLVHGDIKPSNIIIQEHSTRPFIAKLSDFNGVSPVETYGKGYAFGTPEWQSPEVRARCNSIDWQLADVYSFAMVITTIWSVQGFIPLGGSFIDPLLEYTFSEEEKRIRIDCFKFEKGPDPDSIITLALLATQVEETSEFEYFQVSNVIWNGLCQKPLDRLTMRDMLVAVFESFCVEFHRTLPEPDRSSGVVSPTEYFSYDGFDRLIVLSLAYTKRSKTFQRMVFQDLLKYEKSIRNHDPTFSMLSIPEVEKGFKGDEKELLETFNRHNKSLIEHAGNRNLEHFALVAAELGFSYLAGLGTPTDEELGMQWLEKAAMAGSVVIASCFGPYEQSTSILTTRKENLPRRSWAVYATISGHQSSTECLMKLDSALCKIAIRARRLKYLGPTKQLIQENREQQSNTLADNEVDLPAGMIGFWICSCASVGPLEVVRDLLETQNLAAHINNRGFFEFPIFWATRENQFEIARYLLNKGADVSMVSSEGWSMAHCLSFMDDQHAAELTPLFIDGGASLMLEAVETPKNATGSNFDCGHGEPLLWAAMKRKPLLFSALLHGHVRTGCTFNLQRYGVIASTLARSHQSRLLEMMLEQVNGLLHLEWASDEGKGLGEFYSDLVSGLLKLALDSYTSMLLYRRYIHMENFRKAKKETLSLLLRFGADPTNPGAIETPGEAAENARDAVAITVYTNDCDALHMFIEHMESQRKNPETLLRDPERFEGYNALHQSIYNDSREIFLFLIDRYPSLLQAPGKYQRMPLHAAATQQWPGYARELLHRGASLFDRSNDRSTPFTMALMRSPSLETAKVLAESCEDMTTILGADEKSGFTSFGKVLDGLLTYRMSYGVERLEYLIENFGRPSIFACESSKSTVFRSVLTKGTSPTDFAQLRLEDIVLKRLLKTFPDKVNFIDYSGRSPLHYAVVNAKLYAVKTLLEHGAYIDSKMEEADYEHIRKYSSTFPPGWSTMFVGYTPLALAAKLHKQGPGERILQGGRREIEQWERNLKDIMSLLLQFGAETGGPDMESWLWTEQAAGAPWSHNVAIVRGGGRTELERRAGQWPKRLPRNHRSDDNMVEIVGGNGLSVMLPRVELQTMQDVFGAINTGVMVGNLWEQPPAAPEHVIESLRSSHADLKIAMVLQLSLLAV